MSRMSTDIHLSQKSSKEQFKEVVIEVQVDDETSHTTTLITGKRLAFIFCSFMVAFSLVALDTTILSTALPTIASHFGAVSDLSWIASAYFLPQAGFMLFFGRILAIAPPKLVFVISVGIFELGSLFCAVAPSVNFLIFGRAVAGFGATGIWVSIISVIARITTLGQRPLLMGLFGAVFAVCSVVGPLLGGAFTDRVSWRWCFYINLPLGPIAIVLILFLLPNFGPAEPVESQKKAWLNLDWIGTFLSLGMVTTLLIPLQWGGNAKPWSDPSVIALLCLSLVLLLAFIFCEYKQGDNAVLPLKMFKRKNITGACIEAAFSQLAFVIAIYYLPLLYQVRGHSATRSGIDILPFMAAGVLCSLLSGAVISVTGHAWPFLFFFPIIAGAAFGLLFTVKDNTSFARLAGFETLVGVGLGAVLQNTVVVAQAEYVHDEAMVPLATSVVTFMQLIGSGVGVAASGAIFVSQLKTQMIKYAPTLPENVSKAVLSSVDLISSLPAAEKSAVIKAYVAAVTHVSLLGLASCGVAAVSAILISRRKFQVSLMTEVSQ